MKHRNGFKFTAGPWKPELINGYWRVMATDEFGDFTIAYTDDNEECEENTKILAASPELLDHLIGLHKETGYQEVEDFLQKLLGKNPDSKIGEWWA